MSKQALKRNAFFDVVNYKTLNPPVGNSVGAVGQTLDNTSGGDNVWRDAIGLNVTIPSTSADQSINNNTNTVITTWTTGVAGETFDHRYNSSAFNTTTGTYTVPRTGMWFVQARLIFAGNATGVRRVDVISNVSGTAFTLTRNVAQNAGAGETVVVGASAVVRLTAGELVQVAAFQDSGGALNVLKGNGATGQFDFNQFSMIFLGAASTINSV
jgi:hypothetical protein